MKINKISALSRKNQGKNITKSPAYTPILNPKNKVELAMGLMVLGTLGMVAAEIAARKNPQRFEPIFIKSAAKASAAYCFGVSATHIISAAYDKKRENELSDNSQNETVLNQN